jgi:hypothetical protein
VNTKHAADPTNARVDLLAMNRYQRERLTGREQKPLGIHDVDARLPRLAFASLLQDSLGESRVRV